MIEEFQIRARKRKTVAYILLILSILIILCCIVLIIMQLQDLKSQKIADIFNIASRLSFIALIIYITQTLQRLYRYNILKADYFQSCADALKLNQQLTIKNADSFVKIFSSLNGCEITLNETDPPSTPFITKDKDKSKDE